MFFKSISQFNGVTSNTKLSIFAGIMTYINAISYHFPERCLDNESIIQDYKDFGGSMNPEVTPETIFNQCGVNKRYQSQWGEASKELGNDATNKLFEEWNIDRQKIEYLIFVSDALEYKGPTTACIMQRDLQLNTTVAAIDVLHGCTGWIYGLSLAKALITSGQVNNVLVVTADVPTKVIHPIDVDLRAIFSDGAAATLVSDKKIENGINASIENFTFGTDGKGEKSLYVERSGTRDAADVAWLKQHENIPSKLLGGRIRMSSPKIFLFILRKVPFLLNEILEKHNMVLDDVDFFILHQANGTVLEFLRKRLNIPKEKFIISIENTGNTVSSTIPIATKKVLNAQKFKKGNKVLVAGFGIGYSWGGTILTF